jgi:Ca2+-binding RTX toxin-like protein
MVSVETRSLDAPGNSFNQNFKFSSSGIFSNGTVKGALTEYDSADTWYIGNLASGSNISVSFSGASVPFSGGTGIYTSVSSPTLQLFDGTGSTVQYLYNNDINYQVPNTQDYYVRISDYIIPAGAGLRYSGYQLTLDTDLPTPTTPANQAPVAQNDSATAKASVQTTINISNNDSDADGSWFEKPTLSTAILPSQGIVEYTVYSGSSYHAKYTPFSTASGQDTFTYKVTDKYGASDTATVSINITPTISLNYAPVAINDWVNVGIGETKNISVLSNDFDLDKGQIISISGYTNPAKGSLALDQETGLFSYTPFISGVGSDSFSYNITDGNGGTDTANVFITNKAMMNGSNASDFLSAEGSLLGQIMWGFRGNDSIFGSPGGDIIYGNHDLDVLYGGDGNDNLFGGQNAGIPKPADNGLLKMIDGVETLYGGNGEDILYGNFGSDFLFGDEGNDKLFGGQGDDTLSGGAGDDVLRGNRSNDLYVGGSGADQFKFGPGNDIVADFSIAEGDRISGVNLTQITVTDSSNGAVLSDGLNSLTLNNVRATSIDDGFFI